MADSHVPELLLFYQSANPEYIHYSQIIPTPYPILNNNSGVGNSMASRDRQRSMQAERRRLAEERGEPLRTVQRRVIPQGSGNSLYVNIPQLASDLLEIGEGDDVDVEQHDDRVVIRPGGD
jgi:hypothetical protein